MLEICLSISKGFRVVEDEDAFGAQGRKSRRKEEKEKAARS